MLRSEQPAPAVREEDGAPPEDDISAAFQRLIAETRKAAGDSGIRWSEPEGRFVDSLLAGMRMLNETSLRAERSFAAAAADARQVAEAELRKVREVAVAIDNSKHQARAAIEVAQVEHQAALRSTVAAALPGLMEEIRQIVVIREQSWNRDRARANIRAAGLWMLGVFVAGFGLCLGMEWSDSALGAHCRSNLVSAEGGTYCLVSSQPATAGNARSVQAKP